MNSSNNCNLLIDADDTLWENNIYFERVISEVQSMLRPLGVDPDTFRLHLNRREREHIPIHGYGTLNFKRSLVAAVEDFLPDHPSMKETAESMALGILDHPIEIIEGVPETLSYLSERHRLTLVTKGCPEEQTRKLKASGLKQYFCNVEILEEKDESVYRNLMIKHVWDPDQTWMIGNSPRSDINPAISAGMNAVLIPHPHTWVLEHDEPVRHPRLVELQSFSDLRSLF